MGSRANSDWKFVGIRYIKCYFLLQICWQCNTGLLYSFCCAFCGIATYTIFSSFAFFYLGNSLYLCPFLSYLKYSTILLSSLYVSSLLNFTPHLITLLANTSNLLWEVVFPFSSTSLFLQFWARCPNFLQLKHSFPFFPLSSSLSLVREHFCLSMLLYHILEI